MGRHESGAPRIGHCPMCSGVPPFDVGAADINGTKMSQLRLNRFSEGASDPRSQETFWMSAEAYWRR